MLPSASERVPMHPGMSEQVQTRLRTYEHFEKLAKALRRFREGRLRAVVSLVEFVSRSQQVESVFRLKRQ